MKKCTECGSSEIYSTEVQSGGGNAPYLLPGTGIFIPAKFKIYVCGNCGFVKWFVRPEDLEKVKKSKKFKID